MCVNEYVYTGYMGLSIHKSHQKMGLSPAQSTLKKERSAPTRLESLFYAPIASITKYVARAVEL